MPSKEAIEYGEKTICKKLCKICVMSVTGMKCNSYQFAVEAFDAGVASVNKRIGEVNDYYEQLKGMQEDYQAGYLQAEKDMPKQFEAARDIIRLQKEVDELKEHNRWHRIDENSDDLPTEDKEYLVKVIFDVGTGNEHIFLAQWWNENKFWDSLYKDDIVAWKEVE